MVVLIVALLALLRQPNSPPNNRVTKIGNQPPTSHPTPTTNHQIEQLLATMDLDCQLEQLLIIGPGTPINPHTGNRESLRQNLAQHCFGGIIIHANTFINKEMAKQQITDWQQHARYPLFISVDEEGGTVSRLGKEHHLGVDSLPAMQVFGESKDYIKLKNASLTLGQQLHNLGINLNYAPVADILVNSQNTAIGSRSFGSDPQTVASMTAIVVESLQSQKVASTLKHFPGQGAASSDPHRQTTIIDIDEQTWRNREKLPFAAGINAGAQAVMLAHGIYPHLDSKAQLAMFSPFIVSKLLREELKFAGIVITDALNMQAAKTASAAAIATRAIQAGVDMLLLPSSVDEFTTALKTAIASGELSQEQIKQSLRRIWQVKLSLDLLPQQN